MFQIFYFSLSDMGVGIVNPFSRKVSAIFSERSCLISIPFLLTYTDIRTVKFFPLVESLDIRYVPSQIKILLISNPIEKVHASWHGMRGATHTRNAF